MELSNVGKKLMDNTVVEALKKRYSHIHPLIFQRSKEHADNVTHLFDILESMPKKYPLVWDEDQKIWVRCRDINFQKNFFEEMK